MSRVKRKMPKDLMSIIAMLASNNSLRELARQADVATSYISMMCKGKCNCPSAEIIRRIANTDLAKHYAISKDTLMQAAGYIAYPYEEREHIILHRYTVKTENYHIQFRPYKTKKGDMYLLYGWSSDLTIDSVWRDVKRLEEMGYDLEDAKVLGSTPHVRMIKD